jgi:hypothetical protein
MTKKKPGIKTGRPPRHGGYSLLTRGALPEKRKYIGHYLTVVREGLVKDIAPNEDGLTMAQRVLIDRTVTSLGIVRLIEEHAKEHGVLDAEGRPSQGLTGHYLSFQRYIKECIALLGIGKRAADDVLDLGRYLEAKAKNEKTSPAVDTKGGEIVQPGANGGEIRGNEGQGEDEK